MYIEWPSQPHYNGFLSCFGKSIMFAYSISSPLLWLIYSHFFLSPSLFSILWLLCFSRETVKCWEIWWGSFYFPPRPSLSLSLSVSKTNLSVHEDKNRVPYVKVSLNENRQAAGTFWTRVMTGIIMRTTTHVCWLDSSLWQHTYTHGRLNLEELQSLQQKYAVSIWAVTHRYVDSPPHLFNRQSKSNN